MKKLIIIFLIHIFSFNSAYSIDEILPSLKEGGKIIFIRHALHREMEIQKILI